MKQIKILSLGDNSSRTSHNYLPKIAKCDDVELVAGTVFLNSAVIDTHIEAIKSNSEDYCFIYNNEGSVRFNTVENCSFVSAAEWFGWDYIIIQLNINREVSAESNASSASELAELIKKICPSACVMLSLPYTEVSEAAEVAEKTKSLVTLPVAAACEAAMNAGVCLVDEDGTLRGREYDFVTAGVWYEALSGNALTSNGYRLPFVAGELTAIMKNVVHNTVNGTEKRCFYAG